MEKLKDSIDFGTMKVGYLFRRLFVPTLMAMVFSIIFIITDGIFVGQGIGSDALAAINITAPIFLLSGGLALMFGVGASVVASIHLSQGKLKVARINITQAVVASVLLMAIISAVILIWIEEISLLLGASERLLPLVMEYIRWFIPFQTFSLILSSAMFYVRLDGSPHYAMMSNIIAAGINMILDYIFIFEFGWGMLGAALASSLGHVIGATMLIVYLCMPQHKLRFIRIKMSRKSLRLTLRNVGYMCRLGASSFLSEGAVATMMLVGNFVLMNHLGEDGVAAYSIGCYLFPIIYMVYNAIAQSAQPIMSYNYGIGQRKRVRSAFVLSLGVAVGCGLVALLLFVFCTPWIIALFIDQQNATYQIAIDGLPLFASGFVFFGVNMVSIGYFQSLERDVVATCITILRGFVFLLIAFAVCPILWGVPGIWLSVPMSELLTTLCILVFYSHEKRKRKNICAEN